MGDLNNFRLLKTLSLESLNMDGWMDGWMGGWVDGWMDGWILAYCFIKIIVALSLNSEMLQTKNNFWFIH